METQKIFNLFNDPDHESSRFAQENRTLLIIKLMLNMAEEMKIIQQLKLKQK